MVDRTDPEIKLCCATFYQSDLVRTLLGDVIHPGGLELTHRLGTVIGLKAADHVLDIASGRGTSAVYLARQFGCHVTGLDYGAENIAAAEAHASENGVSHLTDFRQGDAERLLFDDSTFDAVISECSFCTFPDKVKAAAEMARVLSPSGCLGLADMTLNGALPDEFQSFLAWIACVAGAGSIREYTSILQESGLDVFIAEDQRSALLEMINDIRHKFMGIELVVKLGKFNLGEIDIDKVKHLMSQALELADNGVLGYTLMAARKQIN